MDKGRKQHHITCYCSGWSLHKVPHERRDMTIFKKNFGRDDTRNNFSKCECRVDGKPVTKIGRDDVNVGVYISQKKGYAAF